MSLKPADLPPSDHLTPWAATAAAIVAVLGSFYAFVVWARRAWHRIELRVFRVLAARHFEEEMARGADSVLVQRHRKIGEIAFAGEIATLAKTTSEVDSFRVLAISAFEHVGTLRVDFEQHAARVEAAMQKLSDNLTAAMRDLGRVEGAQQAQRDPPRSRFGDLTRD